MLTSKSSLGVFEKQDLILIKTVITFSTIENGVSRGKTIYTRRIVIEKSLNKPCSMNFVLRKLKNPICSTITLNLREKRWILKIISAK